jgi:hypothetical protein
VTGRTGSVPVCRRCASVDSVMASSLRNGQAAIY